MNDIVSDYSQAVSGLKVHKVTTYYVSIRIAIFCFYLQLVFSEGGRQRQGTTLYNFGGCGLLCSSAPRPVVRTLQFNILRALIPQHY